ncbi:hypothetical protein [Planctopirus ephydatiae]|nr:hypothetical protein [Planctopirus ephydatiae]
MNRLASQVLQRLQEGMMFNKKFPWGLISWAAISCAAGEFTMGQVAMADKPEKGEVRKSEPKSGGPAGRQDRTPAPKSKVEAPSARSPQPAPRSQPAPRIERRTEAPKQAPPAPPAPAQKHPAAAQATPRAESRPPARIANPLQNGPSAAPGGNRETNRGNPGADRPRSSERPRIDSPVNRAPQIAPTLPGAGTTAPVPTPRNERGANLPDRGVRGTVPPSNPQPPTATQIPRQTTPQIPPRIANPLGGNPAGIEGGGDRRVRERAQNPDTNSQPGTQGAGRNTPGNRLPNGDGPRNNRPEIAPERNTNPPNQVTPNPATPNPVTPNLGSGRGSRAGNLPANGGNNQPLSPVRPQPGLDRRPNAPKTSDAPGSAETPKIPGNVDKPEAGNPPGRGLQPMPGREDRPERLAGKENGPDRKADIENRDRTRGERPEGALPGLPIPGGTSPGRENNPDRPGIMDRNEPRQDRENGNDERGGRQPGLKVNPDRDRTPNDEGRNNRENRPVFGVTPVKPVKARTQDIERQLQDLNRNVQRLASDQREVSRAIDRGNVIPVRIGADGRLGRDNNNWDLSRIQSREQLRELNNSRDLARFFGRNDDRELQTLRIDRVSGRFQDRLVDNRWDNSFRNYSFYNRFNVGRQFELYRRGDVARQLQFSNLLVERGGWRNRYYGPIAPAYSRVSFSGWYAGPRYYPRYTWFPFWSPWVRWSWWNTVPVVYDPRPVYVRPIYCEPAPVWTTVWQYPQYQTLPMVASGTWLDVEPVTVVDNSVDIQLLAVRFVDSGHTEQQLGPRYRVWLRNNATSSISQPFHVVLMAANDLSPNAALPQSGVTIGTMEAGQITSVDIRLPIEANQLFVNAEGRKEPFQKLHLIADTERVLNDSNLENNVAVVDRGEILSVDPAAFSLDTTATSPGTMVSLAGEGLGPEPGRVVITINNQEIDPEIYGWYDLGVQFKIPENIPVNGVIDAQVLVIRGDGAVTNPLDLQIVPAQNLGPAIGWNEQAGI